MIPSLLLNFMLESGCSSNNISKPSRNFKSYQNLVDISHQYYSSLVPNKYFTYQNSRYGLKFCVNIKQNHFREKQVTTDIILLRCSVKRNVLKNSRSTFRFSWNDHRNFTVAGIFLHVLVPVSYCAMQCTTYSTVACLS